MKFFVDTADVGEIRELNELGLIDGVTTNPSLIMKSGRDIREVTKEICDMVSGPVSAEVVATEADAMIAGGTEAAIVPISVAGFASAGALSKRNDAPQEASRPFDAGRDGFILSEGAAVLILERLEHAVARGATILAELAGYGATADANHITQPAPEGEGGQRAMRIALKKAGMAPADVDYINAHGTSTPLNDKYETIAIKSVFGPEAYKIPISSTKSMTGHLLGAGGSLEAAITVMAISGRAVPPTINLEFPDPDCDLDYTPHMPKRGRIRTAMTNSFGFGGHNTSLVFREFEE